MTVCRGFVASEVSALVSILTIDVAREVPIEVVSAARDTRARGFRDKPIAMFIRILEQK